MLDLLKSVCTAYYCFIEWAGKHVFDENSDENTSKIFNFTITLAYVVLDQSHKERTVFIVLIVQDESDGTHIALGATWGADSIWIFNVLDGACNNHAAAKRNRNSALRSLVPCNGTRKNWNPKSIRNSFANLKSFLSSFFHKRLSERFPRPTNILSAATSSALITTIPIHHGLSLRLKIMSTPTNGVCCSKCFEIDHAAS